ncbi:MAG TPA: autotransporter-associated beta strand repeat-containing protein [Pirellulales bacterium]|jgi:autotransporter-associated beta strand protein
MKKPLLAIGISFVILYGITTAQADVFVGWDTNPLSGGTNNFGPSPYTATSSAVGSGLSSTIGLTRGSGMATTGTGAGRAWGGNGWVTANDDTEAHAITNGYYITYGLTIDTGYNANIASIDQSYRHSATGPATGYLQYSLDGTNYFDITTLSFTNNTSSGATLPTIDLSGVAALQGVAAGTTVTFREVLVGGTSTAGTWYVFDVANSTASDLAVSGTFLNLSTTQFWDPSGAAIGGSGTWTTGGNLFSPTAAGGSATTFNSSKLVLFGGTASNPVVTVSNGGSAITVNGMQFDSTGYTLQGDPLAMGSSNNSIVVSSSSSTTTISSKMTGGNGLNKQGAGTLVLTNTSNDFSGGATISGGTLSIGDTGEFGSTSNTITLNGGTLKSTKSGDLALGAGRNVLGTGSLNVGSGNSITIAGQTYTAGDGSDGANITLTNTGTVNLTNAGTKYSTGVTFSSSGTLTVNGGSGTITWGGGSPGFTGITANNTSGTATVNGNVDFQGQSKDIVVNNGASLLINGTISDLAKPRISGTGTVDITGSAIGLINSLQLGISGSGGPTLLLHNKDGLGVSGGGVQTFFAGGAIQATTALTGANAIAQDVSISADGSTSTAANFGTQTTPGSDIEVSGAVFAHQGIVSPTRINVWNNTTFSGGWNPTELAGTVTTISNVILSGTGTLNLSGTLNLDAGLIVDQATVNLKSAFTNSAVNPIVGQGGTLQIDPTGPDNAINTGSKLTIGDSFFAGTTGTFKLNGHAQQLLSLNVQSNGGTIDLGGGTKTLTVGDSTAVNPAWSATGVLTIAGWNYNHSAGSDNHVVFPAAGLTATQLSQIQFDHFHQGAQFAPTLGVTNGLFTANEIVPVVGDINQDGHVNAADIGAIELALTNPSSYAGLHSAFTSKDISFILDVDTNGSVNNGDLMYLISGLKSGGVFLQVPEPSTLVLGLFGAVSLAGVAIRRRRQLAAI